MAVTDYTTTASIRAVLGVSEEELADATITDLIYATQLVEDLYALNADLPADYATIKALPSPSTLQTRFLNMGATWASYDVASKLLASVAMFAPKVIIGNGDEVDRVNDPYADLRNDVAATLKLLTPRLLTLYGQVEPAAPAPAAVARVYSATADLGTDPVTG